MIIVTYWIRYIAGPQSLKLKHRPLPVGLGSNA